MLSIEIILAFVAASCLLALAPGPDNIFVLTQSAMHGRKAGLLITLGLCTGLIVHTVAVALGVAVIFQASALAFTALKLIGAAYLLYLAWGAFRAAAADINTDKKQAALSDATLYKRGIIMNITNPKVAIFFLAFLPQFADPSSGSITTQLLLLGALFIMSALVVFSLIAVLSGSLNTWLTQSDSAQETINRLAGLVFVGLALKLATAEK